MKKLMFFAVALLTLAFASCGKTPGPNNPTGDVKGITLNKTSIILSEIGSERLTATTDPAGAQVTWKSSNTEVATVAANGLVTAAGIGTCTITATAGDKTATCEVEVAGYFDPRVVDIQSFLTMEAEKTGETFTSETSGNTYEWTNYTILLMTNGMAYDREADDFIGPDQCPAFLTMGLGASDDQYIYILGDWEAVDTELTEASTFRAGYVANDTLYGSYFTECVMGAEGYQFGSIYGFINAGSTYCLDQNSVVPRYNMNVTLGDEAATTIVYTKQGSASFDGEGVQAYNLDGHKCVRIPLTLVKEQIAASKKLTRK
ncbi:MAG: Ig-like domain-containing protein [Paludibacteraceae bacterium]|nr:Ig-like domain-containing protein [Paludibacteraceae bacterium]